MSYNAKRYHERVGTSKVRVTVQFDRIGRTKNPPDLNVDLYKVNTDEISKAVYQYARKFLQSTYYDVSVRRDIGRVYIGSGRYGEGTLTIKEDAR